MDAKEFERTLETLDGFKAIFKGLFEGLADGLFGGGKAKTSFAVYSSAQKKGVFDLSVLRREKYNDNYYVILAFSTKGNIDEETLKTTTERVKFIPLGTLRYESAMYSKLEKFRGEQGSLADEAREIASVADEWEDLYIFSIAEFSESALDCPFVIYANKDGKDYIYPVPRKAFEQ